MEKFLVPLFYVLVMAISAPVMIQGRPAGSTNATIHILFNHTILGVVTDTAIPKYVASVSGESSGLPVKPDRITFSGDDTTRASSSTTDGEESSLNIRDILLFWSPLYMLALMVFVICVLKYTSRLISSVQETPIICMDVRNGSTGVCSYPFCNNKLIDNNAHLLYFLRTLMSTPPARSSVTRPCSLSVARFFKKKPATPDNIFPPAPPCSPIPDLEASCSIGNINEAYATVGDPPVVDHEDTLDIVDDVPSPAASICSETSGTSTDSDLRTEILSGMENGNGMFRTLDNDHNNNKFSITCMNPFDPEYVYAALAPDVQPPAYHIYADTFPKDDDDTKTCDSDSNLSSSDSDAIESCAVNNSTTRRVRDKSNLHVTFQNDSLVQTHYYE